MTRELSPPPIWSLPAPPKRRRDLSRDEIVRAAIAIANAGGAEAVTMRAVAARLGSSAPMSLYRYVRNKDGLVDLMLDAAMAEVRTPSESVVDWREGLARLARSMWEMTKQHRWYARLVHTRPPAGPNACRIHEYVLTVFADLGVGLQTASDFYLLINRHVIGLALQYADTAYVQSDADLTVDEIRQTARSWWGQMDTESPYPHLQQLMRRFLDEHNPTDGWAGPDTQLEIGLGCLLDGIANRIGNPG
ncbi:TetR/AcrR family transcriptional regulator [Spelaeicoccus albus]|uniref:AcrR family transcriptional regulator n=1 Tax=Spelaeicoccus albus TaxID=1280376 RepID=A0A7Z0A7T5_9MICO|nr:TetR/AcrR family transcriptional regulator [Spelaeicoccus albus]NYI66022.1 AcrR family transcriptional regulator [Spelaeicoccus albus]